MVVPYTQRKTLTAEERRAISHYKDLKNPQCKWDYKAKNKPDKLGIDCYMINGYLRGTVKDKDLSVRDWVQVNRLIERIRSAIQKCTVRKYTVVYKGLSNPEWFLQNKVGDTIYIKSFMSFSESRAIAEKYAMRYEGDNPIVLLYILRPDDKSLYVDNDEKEHVMLDHSAFKIIGMKAHKFPDGRVGRVYYLGGAK